MINNREKTGNELNLDNINELPVHQHDVVAAVARDIISTPTNNIANNKGTNSNSSKNKKTSTNKQQQQSGGSARVVNHVLLHAPVPLSFSSTTTTTSHHPTTAYTTNEETPPIVGASNNTNNMGELSIINSAPEIHSSVIQPEINALRLKIICNSIFKTIQKLKRLEYVPTVSQAASSAHTQRDRGGVGGVGGVGGGGVFATQSSPQSISHQQQQPLQQQHRDTSNDVFRETFPHHIQQQQSLQAQQMVGDMGSSYTFGRPPVLMPGGAPPKMYVAPRMSTVAAAATGGGGGLGGTPGGDAQQQRHEAYMIMQQQQAQQQTSSRSLLDERQRAFYLQQQQQQQMQQQQNQQRQARLSAAQLLPVAESERLLHQHQMYVHQQQEILRHKQDSQRQKQLEIVQKQKQAEQRRQHQEMLRWSQLGQAHQQQQQQQQQLQPTQHMQQQSMTMMMMSRSPPTQYQPRTHPQQQQQQQQYSAAGVHPVIMPGSGMVYGGSPTSAVVGQKRPMSAMYDSSSAPAPTGQVPTPQQFGIQIATGNMFSISSPPPAQPQPPLQPLDPKAASTLMPEGAPAESMSSAAEDAPANAEEGGEGRDASHPEDPDTQPRSTEPSEQRRQEPDPVQPLEPVAAGIHEHPPADQNVGEDPASGSTNASPFVDRAGSTFPTAESYQGQNGETSTVGEDMVYPSAAGDLHSPPWDDLDFHDAIIGDDNVDEEDKP